jgi:hypothetical protein
MTTTRWSSSARPTGEKIVAAPLQAGRMTDEIAKAICGHVAIWVREERLRVTLFPCAAGRKA